jgi:peptidoglycan/LPS O-acetylase OafA/YrhL
VFFVSPRLTAQFRGAYVLTIGQTLELIATCIALVFVVFRQHGLVFRALNSTPLVVIGLLSYSLYVWNNLFLLGGNLGVLNDFPYNFAAVGLFACLSHYLVEKPFLGLKQRLHPAMSS